MMLEVGLFIMRKVLMLEGIELAKGNKGGASENKGRG
jgi:hypothetical protein